MIPVALLLFLAAKCVALSTLPRVTLLIAMQTDPLIGRVPASPTALTAMQTDPLIGRVPASPTALTAMQADPLIGRLLRASPELRLTSLSDISAAADGLAVWRRALGSGRVPDYAGVDADSAPWPPEPLLGALGSAMRRLDMPRTTSRHPSLIPTALAAVLAAAVRFEKDAAALADDALKPPDAAGDVVGDEADGGWGGDEYDESPGDAEDAADDLMAREDAGGASGDGSADTAAAELSEAAQQIAEALAQEWGAPLRGVCAIESLAAGRADAGAATSAPGASFSPHDGLWSHRGWTAMESVQAKLRELDELSELFASLGQRAAAEGAPERGPAVLADPRATPSAALSDLAPREIAGLCRTGDLARVAPSELVLLARTPAAASAATAGAADGRGARRRLFLSRLVERRLLGYSLEGWADASARPKPKRRARLPRTRGGPLVVCLDTSHSMTGGRERLAKAVVLEAVRTAHQEGRPCLLFAFSGESDLAELRLTPPRRKGGGARAGATDRQSLSLLLDFLACSFGGGTDVAGPLRRALDVLEAPQQDEELFSGADLLLVSDGELPDPPLDAATFARLRALQASQGFEVHGLLVGKPRPTPLDQMCDTVHTCLSRFDPLALLREASEARVLASLAAEAARRSALRRGAPSAARSGAVSMRSAEPASSSIRIAPSCPSVVANINADHSCLPFVSTTDPARVHPNPSMRSFEPARRAGALRMSAVAEEDVDEAARLRSEAEEKVVGALAEAEAAADAREAGTRDFPPFGALSRAALAIESGLVEREAEARLLLLALAGAEHLLLLGPPGTAKSELCRRLSAVCRLSYFERTLTRFSTPEELFGPLSLAALERDEFRRNTAGYAPEAEVITAPFFTHRRDLPPSPPLQRNHTPFACNHSSSSSTRSSRPRPPSSTLCSRC